MTNEFLSELQWNALLRGIEQDKCVICIGPEFYSASSDGRSQSTRLGNFMREHALELGVRVRENGWYHLRNNGDDWVAYEAVTQFYAGEAETARTSLEQLARINAHLYLSLTPDRHLAQAFTDQNLHYRFEAYIRNEPDRNGQLPTKSEPLIYNMVGDLEQRNSLVLTYDDFFDYMQSTFRGNSMSTLLKENILSADCFLFLGMPPDDWRMHLFLRVLKQHESRKSKYATMPKVADDIKESWQEQYGIRLINDDISGFLGELAKRCADRGLLRDPESSQGVGEKITDQLREKVGRVEIAPCLDLMQQTIKQAKAAGKDLMLQIIQLRGRLRTLEDKEIGGIISQEDKTLENNQISHALLQLIDRLEAEAPQLGIRL
ncbi:SIR2 family protein [Neolewinella persica]|uniref:SIR2 family protein n=1 Tax=Neolewinella persica TaxID=70998 RepID=UPI0003818685|nr:SIR2 family protein [Neolewinella persica]